MIERISDINLQNKETPVVHYHNRLTNSIMYRIGFCLFVLFILNTELHAQGTAAVDPLAPGDNIYRHYAGTVGNHKAVLDLRYGFKGASNFGGSTCYFTDEGGLSFFLISQPPTFSDTELFRAQVFPEDVPLSEIKNVYSIFVQTQRFEFKLSKDSLNGKWFAPGAMEQLSISLKEDYSNALPFIFKNAADSVIAVGRKNDTMKAIVSYKGVEVSPGMKKTDAVFINHAVARFMSNAKASVKDPHDFPEACFRKFFTDFKVSVNEGKEVNGGTFRGIFTLFPVYNDDGFLVLQKGGYQYDFENKEYTDRYLYLCLDVKNKKTLKLDDILLVNNEALTALLEKAFRKKYHLEPGKKLNDMFISDKMPLTDNIIVVNKGLIFSYWPVKIFRDDADISELQEMRLFLSYDELGTMLKLEFKSRVGLK
jgi:hypothetical protein